MLKNVTVQTICRSQLRISCHLTSDRHRRVQFFWWLFTRYFAEWILLYVIIFEHTQHSKHIFKMIIFTMLHIIVSLTPIVSYFLFYNIDYFCLQQSTCTLQKWRHTQYRFQQVGGISKSRSFWKFRVRPFSW